MIMNRNGKYFEYVCLFIDSLKYCCKIGNNKFDA